MKFIKIAKNNDDTLIHDAFEYLNQVKKNLSIAIEFLNEAADTLNQVESKDYYDLADSIKSEMIVNLESIIDDDNLEAWDSVESIQRTLASDRLNTEIE